MTWLLGNKDRRKAPRTRVELKARFQVRQRELARPITAWEPARVCDLSRGGLRLACARLASGEFSLVRCLEEEAEALLWVELNSGEMVWELGCRIVWLNRLDEPGEMPCRLGLVICEGSHPRGWRQSLG